MHRFFSEGSGVPGDRIVMSEEDSAHALRVLRLDVGDTVEMILPDGNALGVIVGTGTRAVQVELQEMLGTREAMTRVTLYQGYPKADKMELIVQKGTELGYARIVPVCMDRSVVKLSGKDAGKKADRLRKIAREAVKQCGRSASPEVMAPMSLREAISYMADEDVMLIPWEEEGTIGFMEAVKTIRPGTHVGLLIGPEGGISEEEIAEIRGRIQASTVSLGPRILRTETAAIASVAALMAVAGEWDIRQ